MIAVAVGSCLVPRQRLGPALLVGALCAVIPDLDLLAPYLGAERDFHRRFTHSIAFAVLAGLSCAAADRVARRPRAEAMWLGVYAALATLSHAIADMLTTYPLGVAVFSPFSESRHHLPWRPITSVMREMGFIFVPALLVAVGILRFRSIGVHRPSTISMP